MNDNDKIGWKCKTRLEKRHGDINECITPEDRRSFLERIEPYEVIEREGNILLTVGAERIWQLVANVSAIHFDATTTIGIGNDNTAANAAQTDLIGASKKYNAMEATFPSIVDNVITFKSSFGAAEANWAWEEWVIKRTTCLNRKVEVLGTKAGGTWTFEVTITLA